MPQADDRGGATGSTRSLPRILVVLAAVFLAARIVLAFIDKPVKEAEESTVPTKSGSELVHWASPDSAEQLAAKAGKPILYEFAAAWCGPCKTMKAEVFSDEKAAAYINDTFVPSRIVDRAVEDGRNTPLVEDLQKRFKVKAFPTVVVVVQGREPVILEGYGGRDAMLAQLRDAVAH